MTTRRARRCAPWSVASPIRDARKRSPHFWNVLFTSMGRIRISRRESPADRFRHAFASERVTLDRTLTTAAHGRTVRLATLATATMVTGCGGGVPLLVPARTLPLGEVLVASGLCGNVAAIQFANALGGARDANAATGGNDSAASPVRARSTLIAASIGPGISPVVSARVGLGAQADGGIAFMGRAVRADLRRSVSLLPHWSLSAGIGGSAVVGGHDEVDADADLSRLHGGGADVPVVVGYESDGGLYAAWVGARGGWEQVSEGDARSDAAAALNPGPPLSLSATRWWTGGLIGFAVGFRHVHVAMELDMSYARVSGDAGSTHVDIAGLTVCPASAVWWRF